MVANTQGGGDGEAPSDLEAATMEMTSRLIASAMGLPHVCVHKKCRRRKRCFGNYGTPRSSDIPCLRRHQGLARQRFASALKILGWPNRNEDGSKIPSPRGGEG